MQELLGVRDLRAERPLRRVRADTRERFAVTTCREHPELFEAAVALENKSWDKMSFLDYTAAHHDHYEELYERFPDHHLCMVELESQELVATGLCVPLRIADNEPLPGEGWDWIVETAVAQGGRGANAVGALSISVDKGYQSRGVARDMINTMRALAASRRCASVVAPVRPSHKHFYPFVPMAEYITWRDERGRIFDPWVRSHIAVGGELVGVCDRSMVVEQPIEFWRSWTDSALDEDGIVPLEGALVPLDVDTKAGRARYVEPNVWVRHAV
jgi:GNAT superfamily N-acetyltransferase